MPKKFIVRKFNPGKEDHNKINTLINLSALNLNTTQSVLQTSLALGASETSNTLTADTLYPYDLSLDLAHSDKEYTIDESIEIIKEAISKRDIHELKK